METITNEPKYGILTFKKTVTGGKITTNKPAYIFEHDGLIWERHSATATGGHFLCMPKDVRNFEVL
jgi:hypothetical protein